jgi:hypothetical protein
MFYVRQLFIILNHDNINYICTGVSSLSHRVSPIGVPSKHQYNKCSRGGRGSSDTRKLKCDIIHKHTYVVHSLIFHLKQNTTYFSVF